MSAGAALIIFGLVGLLAPALTEIGEGMLAAGAIWCLGAYAGRKGAKAAPWVLTAVGIALGLGLASRFAKNRSHRIITRQLILSVPAVKK